jgi:ketosteroid isomerase-like protein
MHDKEGDMAEKDLERVRAVTREENNAIVAGDPERYFTLLATDCVMLPPNTAPKTGRELREWLKEFLNSVTVVSRRYAHGETVVAGDWAWTEYACDWSVTPKAGGATSEPRFKGLDILRKDSGGAWKIVRNIWNLNPPPS